MKKHEVLWAYDKKLFPEFGLAARNKKELQVAIESGLTDSLFAFYDRTEWGPLLSVAGLIWQCNTNGSYQLLLRIHYDYCYVA